MEKDKYAGYFEVYHPKYLEPMAIFKSRTEAETFALAQAFPGQCTIVQIGEDENSANNKERLDARSLYVLTKREFDSQVADSIIILLRSRSPVAAEIIRLVGEGI